MGTRAPGVLQASVQGVPPALGQHKVRKMVQNECSSNSWKMNFYWSYWASGDPYCRNWQCLFLRFRAALLCDSISSFANTWCSNGTFVIHVMQSVLQRTLNTMVLTWPVGKKRPRDFKRIAQGQTAAPWHIWYARSPKSCNNPLFTR